MVTYEQVLVKLLHQGVCIQAIQIYFHSIIQLPGLLKKGTDANAEFDISIPQTFLKKQYQRLPFFTDKESALVQFVHLLDDLFDGFDMVLFIQRFNLIIQIINQALKSPGIHPAIALVERHFPFVKLNHLIIADDLSQSLQRRGKGAVGGIAICIRPKCVRYLFLGHILPSQGDNSFQQCQRFLGRFFSKPDQRAVLPDFKTAHCSDIYGIWPVDQAAFKGVRQEVRFFN